MEHRILIVDQDAHWRRLYTEALSAEPGTPGAVYKITALSSPAAAKLQMTRQRFQVVVVAGDEASGGLRLAATLKELYGDEVRLLISYDPTTNKQELQRARALGIVLVNRAEGGEALAHKVAELLGLRNPAPAVAQAERQDDRPPATLADVQMLLDMLRREARAQFALYANNVGHIIAQHGDDSDLDVPSLASLTAGSYVNSTELGRVLHDPDTVHMSVHEGRFYDIYSANVGHDRMLALLFQKEIVDPKLGFVFLLLKRAALQLKRMRLVFDDRSMLDQQLTDSLNDEFDRMFGSELFEEAGRARQ